jgi:hypothetical protein
MTRSEFLDHVQSARAEWDALLASIPIARFTELGVVDNWSLKDIIAHISWFEREMIGVIQQRALAGSPLWNEPTDARNAVIYKENKNRTLRAVRDEARRVYPELYSLLETLSDDDLNNPANFRDMLSDWLPWHIFAQNTYEHYEHHTRDVRDWLKVSPANQRELLKRHTHLYNYGVRSGNFAPMLQHFKPDAELIFEGIPVGPFKGKPAIEAAYAAQPPSDEIQILNMHEEIGGVAADYAWRNAPEERAGQMIATFEREKLARLIIIYLK